MKRNLILLFTLLLVSSCYGAELTKEQVDKITSAIYRAEGGSQTRYPYGIRSVRVRDSSEARMFCVRSIKNNYSRWESAGKPGCFIVFMGKRYCPPTKHALNSNWVHNVKADLGERFLKSLK